MKYYDRLLKIRERYLMRNSKLPERLFVNKKHYEEIYEELCHVLVFSAYFAKNLCYGFMTILGINIIDKELWHHKELK